MCPQQCMGYTYTTNIFIVYLKFKFNWASCILSDNPVSMLRCTHSWEEFSFGKTLKTKQPNVATMVFL